MRFFFLLFLGHWTYANKKEWPNLEGYKMCGGAKQSPIALSYDKSTYNSTLQPVKIYQKGDYRDDDDEKFSMTNNGHTRKSSTLFNVTFTVMISFPSCHYFIKLNDVEDGQFCIKQVHFHWGKVWSEGSEHTLDGINYALEVRFL